MIAEVSVSNSALTEELGQKTDQINKTDMISETAEKKV